MKTLYLIALILTLAACESNSKTSKVSEKETTTDSTPNVENVVEYYPNGTKKIEGKRLDGKRHGKWKYYYENGFLWSEGFYKNGEREGNSVVYYDNGRKKIQGQYKKNYRTGVWKVWESDGSLAGSVNINETLTKEDSLMLDIR